MHEAFGVGRFEVSSSGAIPYAMAFPGCHQPVPLLIRNPPEKLAEFNGQNLRIQAALPEPGGQLEVLTLQALDLFPTDEEPFPLQVCLAGSIYNAAEPNPSGDRVTTSLLYANPERTKESSCYIKISVVKPQLGLMKLFQQVEARSRIVVGGDINTYEYNGKPRVEVYARSIQLLRSGPAVVRPDAIVDSDRTPLAVVNDDDDAFAA